MDIQRNLLIVALVLVSGMVLTEWVKFRDTHTEQLAVAEAAAIAAAAPAAPSATAVPSASATAAADIPSLQAAGDAAAAPIAANAQQTITVRTDSLLLDISLLGGDITSVALPRHLANLDRGDQPFQLLEQNAKRNYIAMSGLIGANGTDTANGRPLFSTGSTSHEMQPDQDELVVDLNYTTAEGVAITKRFTFQRGEYVVGVEYLVTNNSDRPWQAALFGQLKRDNRPDPGATGGALGIKPFIGFATRTTDEPYQKFTFDNIAENAYEGANRGGWVALVQHYFISAWIPAADAQNTFSMLKTAAGDNIARFTSPELQLAPRASGSIGAQFYAGPKDQSRLREIAPGLDLTVDYGWLWWIAQPLFALLYLKINPLGGCLPILLQMPVFIALYWVLLESVELRQAPFMLWITDLSLKDPYFVLPILMGISMWFQTRLNPAPPDPMQAKMMQWLPWIFTVFFLFFASGLVLYWLVNNVLSIAQQWYITHQIEKEHAKA
jgi:YidC/Oxa1 family membrane protein insertase